jgi:uncharacterized repeat protein (TIGR02543 family)
MLSGYVKAVGMTVIKEKLEDDGYLINWYNEGTWGVLNAFSADAKAKLGEVGDALKTIDTVVTAWNTASQINQQMVKIAAAQEQAEALTRYILEFDAIQGTPVYEEVQAIQKGLEDGFDSQQTNFINELQKALLKEDFLKDAVMNNMIVGSIDKIFFDGAAYGVGTVIRTLQVLYSTAEYVFDWAETASVYHSLKVGSYISLALENSTIRLQSEPDNSGDFLVSLKYLIKMRIVGERTFISLANKYTGPNGNYNAQNILDDINEESSGDTYESLNAYYLAFKELILGYRDSLYDEVTTDAVQPPAPAVTIDYINERTVETFANTYEYSFNNVDWTTCGEQDAAAAIKITPKTKGQTLYVRKKETKDSRVGLTAVTSIPEMASHRYATGASQLRSICMIQGVTPNHVYEILLSDSNDTTDLDWSNAIIATANDDGQLSTTVSTTGNYLLYRYPATSSSFASDVHSIAIARAIMVDVSADVEGEGRVLSDGEEFTSRTIYAGDTLNLNVEYDTISTSFEGWYNGDNLYSSRESLNIEVTESLSLTARFAELPQYTMTIGTLDGGRVDGGGTVYKGQTATARAYADNGYTFYGWVDGNGNLVSVNSTRTVTMTKDVSLTAKFEQLPRSRIFVSLSVQSVEGMQEPGVKVEVDGKEYEVTNSNSLRETSGEILQGVNMTLTANSTQDATFVSWQNSNGQVVSTNNVFNTTTEEYTYYTAVYKVSGQSVTFANKDNSIRSQRQYLASAQSSDIIIPTGIYMSGYEFKGWKMGGTDKVYDTDNGGQDVAKLQEAILEKVTAGEEVVLNAIYQQEEKRYNVTVANGTGSGTYTASSILTITAKTPDAGKYFAGWYENGVLLTTNRSYSLYVNDNHAFEAKYSEQPVDEVGTTRIETVTSNKGTKKISFVSMSSVPTSCTIQKAGVIATLNDAIGTNEDNFTASTATYVRYGTTTAHNYKYTWTKGSVAAGQTVYVRAYLVYTDGNGNSHTVYGDVVSATLDGTTN